MRALIQYAVECMQELDNLNIPYGDNIEFEVNERADHRWGRCQKTPNGYVVSISNKLLDERTSIKGLKETIHHELLHTVYGCMNHGEKWKRLAARVKSIYGYDVKRTNSSEEKGLCDEMIAEIAERRAKKLASQPTYIVECLKCGHKYIRHKLSKLVTDPDRYRCGECNGELMRIQQ